MLRFCRNLDVLNVRRVYSECHVILIHELFLNLWVQVRVKCEAIRVKSHLSFRYFRASLKSKSSLFNKSLKSFKPWFIVASSQVLSHSRRVESQKNSAVQLSFFGKSESSQKVIRDGSTSSVKSFRATLESFQVLEARKFFSSRFQDIFTTVCCLLLCILSRCWVFYISSAQMDHGSAQNL